MKTRIRFGAMFMVVLLLTGTLLACGGKAQLPTQTSKADHSVTADPEDELAAKYLPAKQDFDRYEYRMLVETQWCEDVLRYMTADAPEDDVSNALFSRNEFLMDESNIVINVQSGTDVANKVHQAVLIGDDLWDVVCMVDAMNRNVPQGDFLDVNTMKGFCLDAPYWNQQMIDAYNVNGATFRLGGDFTIYDELRSSAVVFNADRYSRYDLDTKYGDLYSIVKGGKWTYETMLSMFKNTTNRDMDHEAGKDDDWGLLVGSIAPFMFFQGSGFRTVKMENGTLTTFYENSAEYETCYNMVSRILDSLINNREVLFSNGANSPLLSERNPAEVMNNMFAADKALFYVGTVYDTLSFSEMSSSFGILPIPKYTETQDSYHCWVASSADQPISFPATLLGETDRRETVAAITEAMCYYSRYSKNSVYASFWDRMALSDVCKTDNDHRMLSIIYESKTYDIDAACNFTRLMNMTMYTVSGSNLCVGFSRNVDLGIPTYDTLFSTFTRMKEPGISCVQTYLDKVSQNVKKDTVKP